MRERRAVSAAAAAPLAVALAISAGCLVGPNYQPPPQPPEDAYAAPPQPEPTPGAAAGAIVPQRIAPGEAIPGDWWQLFHSARLDAVLREAIASSPSLAAADATLAEAREEIVVARSALYPRLDLGAGARRGGALDGGAANLFTLGPTVSFTIDAFGQARRQVEEASAVAERQRDQLAAAYLTLTGSSVTQAITIASTRLQIATAEELIRNDEKDLDMTQRLFAAGRVAKTDVLTVEAELESDRTLLPTLHQQLDVARHALTILVGREPGRWSPPDFDMDELSLPPELPLSLPSALVRQRPDILAAEADLHAASAAIGVATAQMYPQITLSASLVTQAVSLADLFEKASTLWSAAAAANAPITHGGALTAQRRAAVDAYDAQLAVYEETILQAFGQVADALTAVDESTALLAASQHALEIAGESLDLQRKSYAAGKTSALQLIVSENTYSQARLGHARAQAQRLESTAALFVALGGGWWNANQPSLAETSAAASR